MDETLCSDPDPGDGYQIGLCQVEEAVTEKHQNKHHLLCLIYVLTESPLPRDLSPARIMIWKVTDD